MRWTIVEIFRFSLSFVSGVGMDPLTPQNLNVTSTSADRALILDQGLLSSGKQPVQDRLV